MDQMDTQGVYGVQLQAMHESRKLEQESNVAATSPARPRKEPPSPDKSESVEWWKVVLIVLVVVGMVLAVMGGVYYVSRFGWPWNPILPPTDSVLRERLNKAEKERDKYVCSNTRKENEIINLKAECLSLKNEVTSKDAELKALRPLRRQLEATQDERDNLRSDLKNTELQARAAERLADTRKGQLDAVRDEMEKNQGSGGLVEVLAAVQSLAMPAASVRPAGTAATASAPTAPAAAPAGSSRMHTSASTTVEDENDPDTISMYIEGGDDRARSRAVRHTATRPEVDPPLAENERHLASYNGPPLASDDDSKEGGEDDRCSIHTGSSAGRGARNNSSAFSCNGDTVDEFADE